MSFSAIFADEGAICDGGVGALVLVAVDTELVVSVASETFLEKGCHGRWLL